MKYIIVKPIAAGAALLAGAVLADAYDGTMNFSLKGAPQVISAVTSTSAYGDNIGAARIPNTMIGHDYVLPVPKSNRVNGPIFDLK